MAYGTKYEFEFENIHGVVYDIRIQKRNYSGTITHRPLGSAPVIRMQENGPFRSTSCELTIECQLDGEYAELYTSDPQEYKVLVYNNTILIWEGFVATELYSEPDIAPPYDVKVTATDGIGALKEYDFEPAGPQTIRKHLEDLLSYTGLSLGFNVVTSVKEYNGAGTRPYPLDTPNAFIDKAMINLDFYDGKSVYEALEGLLSSLRCTITQWNSDWLIIRKTDITVNSNNRVPGYYIPVTRTTPTYSTNINLLTATAGQMGVANMWPVGYLTRRVVPAKNRVTVVSPFRPKNGFPVVSNDGWTAGTNASFDSTYNYYALGITTGSVSDRYGSVSASLPIFRYTSDFRVKIKASMSNNDAGLHIIYLTAEYTDTHSQTYYYMPGVGWKTYSEPISTDGSPTVNETNSSHDINLCESVEFVLPSLSDTFAGVLTITVHGYLADIYDIDVQPVMPAGYEDVIEIDNLARGAAEKLELVASRLLDYQLVLIDFYQGLFFDEDTEHGSTTRYVILKFDDNDNTGLDYLSLTALNYAKEHAAPRIEISGTLDVPSTRIQQPLLIKSHGVWALMESYDWNLKEAEINFKAITLPTASLTVDSETITSLPNK